MKTLMAFMQSPRMLTKEEQVGMARSLVKEGQAMGLTYRKMYEIIHTLEKVLERAEWRLKDNAFHESADRNIVFYEHDADKEY